MNLKELKKMIGEEYSRYISEQPIPAPGEMGGMPGPAISVSDTDVDATGDEDAEATLKDIYDMLKAYFEGGAGDDMEADVEDDLADLDTGDEGGDEDEDDDEKEPTDESLQERFQKLANIIKG